MLIKKSHLTKLTITNSAILAFHPHLTTVTQNED